MTKGNMYPKTSRSIPTFLGAETSSTSMGRSLTLRPRSEGAIQGDNTVDRVVLGRGKDVEHFTIDLWRPPYQVLTRGNMGLVEGAGWREHRIEATVERYKSTRDGHKAGHAKRAEIHRVRGALVDPVALSSRANEQLRGAVRRGLAALLGLPVSKVFCPREALDGS